LLSAFWHLILANYFTFGALLLQFRLLFIWVSNLAFAFSSSAQTVCFQLWFFAYHFVPSLFLLAVDFLAVYKLFQHTTFCFGIYALHIRIFAVTDCFFLSLKDLPVYRYHLFVPI